MTDPVEDGATIGAVGGVATILFDQPRRRNAMRLRTWRALPALVAAVERDASVRLIILRGAGGVFGAGNDIAEFAALRGDAGAAAAYGFAMADGMRAVEEASKPVLVAIQGQCYGASVALALAGDVRVASSDASFAITPAKLGALYLSSDLHRLVAAVGPGRARRLIYSGEAIDAARAEAIGLVDEVFPADRFEAEVTRLSAAIVAGSSFTLRESKRMLRAAGRPPTPAETFESLAPFVAAMQGADFAEGVDAFLAKRQPRFA